MKRAVLPSQQESLLCEASKPGAKLGLFFEGNLFFHELLGVCSPCARDSRATVQASWGSLSCSGPRHLVPSSMGAGSEPRLRAVERAMWLRVIPRTRLTAGPLPASCSL